jgi:hypothetical protein
MPPSLIPRTARALFVIAMIAATFGTLPVHAERVEPPLELLYAPGNLLVAGTVAEINPSGRVVFERKDVLAGGKSRPPEQIDVRVPPSVVASVKPGQRYIFGYSTARADPRNPTRTVANPDGPVLLTSIGLDPALFNDTPEARAILKAGRSEHGRESRHLFELLMKALAGSDRPLQNLVAGEIALEPEIGERLRDKDRAVIEKVARDPHAPPPLRASLLQSGSERPADLGDWWQGASLDVVTTTPLDGYAGESSSSAGLVLQALEVLDKHAIRVAPDALTRWVRSPDPPLVERASLMLRREGPELERAAIREALADPKLPGRTRQFLNDHLRRLDLLDARLKARKGGAE